MGGRDCTFNCSRTFAGYRSESSLSALGLQRNSALARRRVAGGPRTGLDNVAGSSLPHGTIAQVMTDQMCPFAHPGRGVSAEVPVRRSNLTGWGAAHAQGGVRAPCVILVLFGGFSVCDQSVGRRGASLDNLAPQDQAGLSVSERTLALVWSGALAVRSRRAHRATLDGSNYRRHGHRIDAQRQNWRFELCNWCPLTRNILFT